MNLIDALRHFTVAAIPFTRWIGQTAEAWSKYIDHAAQAGRETGRIGSFLNRTRAAMTQFGHILRDVWFTLMNVAKAMRPSGQSLWASIEKAAHAWREFTGSTQGQVRMRVWFAHAERSLRTIWDILKQTVRIFVAFGKAGSATGDSLWQSIDRAARRYADWANSLGGQNRITLFFVRTKSAFVAMARLADELVKAILRMGEDSGLAKLTNGLTKLVPLLEKFLNNLAHGLGPAMVTVLNSALTLLSRLSGATGPLAAMLRMIGKLIDAVTWLVDHVPGIGMVFEAALGVLLIDIFIGRVQRLAASWMGVAGAAERAAVAEGAASGRGMVGTGIGRMGGRGMLGNLGSIGLFAGGYAADQFGGSLGHAAAPALYGAGIGTMFGGPIGGVLGGLAGASYSLARSLWAKPQGSYDPGGYTPMLQQMVTPYSAGPGGRLTQTRGAAGRRLGSRLLANPGSVDQAATNIASIDRIRKTVELDMVRLHLNKQNMAAAQAYLDYLEQQRQVQQQLLGQERQRAQYNAQLAAGKSNRQARTLLTQYGNRFNVTARRSGVSAAMTETTGFVTRDLAALKPEGQRILANNVLHWAHAAARANPALTDEYEKLKQAVLGKFREMGQKVAIVNDSIISGTDSTWKQLSNILGTHAERGLTRVSAAFDAIRAKAVAALMQMGFNAGNAAALVHGVETGRVSAGNIAGGGTAGALLSPEGGAAKHALGGRIGGRGYKDTVSVAPGHLAAPGELILNRHTEGRVDRMLAPFGTSLNRETMSETRSHDILPNKGGRGRKYAMGGRMTGFPGIMQAAAGLNNAHVPYLYGGGHSTPAPLGPMDCSAAVSYVLQQAGIPVPTMTSTGYMGWGNAGPGLVSLFANPGHVFMSIAGRGFGTSRSNPAGGPGWLPYNSRPGFTVRSVPPQYLQTSIGTLTAPPSGIGGWPGTLADAAGGLFGAGMTKGINNALSNPATFAGWFGGGGELDVRRPTMIGVGDGPGTEHVSITRGGKGGRGPIVVKIGQIVNNRPGDIRRIVEQEVSEALDHLASTLETQPMVGDSDVMR